MKTILVTIGESTNIKPTDPVIWLGFRTKEKEALLKLGIITILDFLKFDLQEVFKLSGYGQRTYFRLVTRQKAIKDYFANVKSMTIAETDRTIYNPYMKNCKIGLQDQVTQIELSIREQKVLSLLGVKTVKDILELDTKKVFELRSYGKKTYEIITRRQKQLSAYFQSIASKTSNNDMSNSIENNLPVAEDIMGREPFSEKSIEQLPLYSLFLFGKFDVSKLHPSFCPNHSISELDLKTRSRNCLNDLGIATVGELLGVNEEQLLKHSDLGIGTLNQIRDAVRSFLFQKNGLIPPPTMDYSSFDNLIFSWLQFVLRDTRKIKIIVQHFGGFPAEGETLEKCAQGFGITRERARQLIKAGIDKLRLSEKVSLLNSFWTAVEDILSENKGSSSKERLANEISKYFKWDSLPIPEFLVKILCIKPGFIDNRQSLITLHSSPCPDCIKVPMVLKRIFEKVEEMRISDVTSAINKSCKRLCERHSIPIGRFNDDFTKMIIIDQQSNSFLRIDGFTVYLREKWEMKFSSLPELSLALLKKCGKPMHITELCSQLQELRNFPISENDIHPYLKYSTDAILWNKDTFIHRDNIKITWKLIYAIETWILKHLSNSNIPFASIYLAFKKHREECLKSGVISEYALYSCLRESDSQKLKLFKFPYILKNSPSADNISLQVILEKYIQKRRQKTPVRLLRSFLFNRMLFKSSHVESMLRSIPNVIRTDDKCLLHTSMLRISKDDLNDVKKYIKRMLVKNNSISIKKVFKNKESLCRLKGVTGPKMLFSVLIHLYRNEFDLAYYPQIRLLDTGFRPNVSKARDEIMEFIISKNRPVSFNEIHHKFVDKLGYSPHNITILNENENLFRHSHHYIVHNETIGWDEEKQRKLEHFAQKTYNNAIRSGLFWGNIGKMLENKMKKLPKLQHGVPWTKRLIEELLASRQEFIVLGNKRDAFLPKPNKHKINDFNDLISIVLKKIFGGEGRISIVSKYLRKYGAIKGRLQRKMFKKDGKIKFSRRNIAIRRIGR
jgi:DNA-directed RNA polymerase alpha subunit